MITEVLKDFVWNQDVTPRLIEEYQDKIPEELMEVWKNYGFGSFMNGYLKIINPEEYVEIVNDESLFVTGQSYPIFATAFGDIIVWRDNHFLDIVDYRHAKTAVMLAGMEFFFPLLCDDPKEFIDDFFEIKKYEQAVKKYGSLAYEECFGYVPILSLGGKESVKNLKKVKMKEHLALIVEMGIDIWPDD